MRPFGSCCSPPPHRKIQRASELYVSYSTYHAHHSHYLDVHSVLQTYKPTTQIQSQSQLQQHASIAAMVAVQWTNPIHTPTMKLLRLKVVCRPPSWRHDDVYSARYSSSSSPIVSGSDGSSSSWDSHVDQCHMEEQTVCCERRLAVRVIERRHTNLSGISTQSS